MIRTLAAPLAAPLAAAALLAASAAPALAQTTPARCVALSQLAMSGWIGMLAGAQSGNGEAAGQGAERLAAITQLYGAYDCPAGALHQSVECLVTGATAEEAGAAAAGQARACLRRNGLAN